MKLRYYALRGKMLIQYLGGRPPHMHAHYWTAVNTTKTYKPNGKREVARRLRQMEARRA